MKVFFDTTSFFGPKSLFLEALSKNLALYTSSIVVYEFYKIITMEIHKAESKKKNKRVEMLKAQEERLLPLLEDIEIEILPAYLNTEIIAELKEIRSKFDLDIGDALNYLIMRENRITQIISKDGDWDRVKGISILRPESE